MRRLILSVLTFACALLVVTSCSAQAGGGSGGKNNQTKTVDLEGMVYGPSSGTALNNIKIELLSPHGGVIATSFTDPNGRFSFRGLAPATYIIQVNETGYDAVRESLDLTFGSNRSASIFLKNSEVKGQTQSGPTTSAHELALPQKVRDVLEEGRKKLYGKKDPRGSLADFQTAIDGAPGCYEAYYEMGAAHWQLGQTQEAEAAFHKSLELSEEKYGRADLGLGALLADRNQFANAEKFLRHGLESEPTSWLGQFELARVLFGEGRLEEAETSALQARDLKPDAPGIYRLLTNIHLRMNNTVAALQDLDIYIKLDPDSPGGQQAKQLREKVQRSAAQAKSPAAEPPKP
jgi:tetratricopeptide (TPR) repeat protein